MSLAGQLSTCTTVAKLSTALFLSFCCSSWGLFWVLNVEVLSGIGQYGSMLHRPLGELRALLWQEFWKGDGTSCLFQKHWWELLLSGAMGPLDAPACPPKAAAGGAGRAVVGSKRWRKRETKSNYPPLLGEEIWTRPKSKYLNGCR